MPHLEFPFLFFLAMWVAFGAASIVYFFLRGLAVQMISAPGRSPALGYLLVVVLLPLLVVLGGISFLWALLAERPVSSAAARPLVHHPPDARA